MKVGLCLFQDDVCIQTEEGIKHCKLIAVHAGLERDEAVDEQLKTLKAKDTRVPKVGPLSGRASVWEIPKVRVHQILHFFFTDSESQTRHFILQ